MKNNNLFFWTGEEDFLIKEKRALWEEAFSSKHGGDINISVIDGKELSAGEIISNFETVPFLAEKRLVFVNNLPPKANEKIDSKKSEAILSSLALIAESTVLVFIQNKPDKRTSFYKKLIKIAQTEEFKAMKEKEVEDWLKNYIKKRDAEILPSALSFLVKQTGTNLWKLSQEANKLISYNRKEKAISENDIQKLVIPHISSNIFSFLDAFSDKKDLRAIKELHNIIIEGESLMQLFALLTKHIRSLLLASSLERPTKEAIIKEVGLHPFAAQKIMYSLKNYKLSELRKLYKNCLEIDTGIKTGRISLSAGNEKALALEIEKMIISL